MRSPNNGQKEAIKKFYGQKNIFEQKCQTAVNDARLFFHVLKINFFTTVIP